MLCQCNKVVYEWRLHVTHARIYTACMSVMTTVYQEMLDKS